MELHGNDWLNQVLRLLDEDHREKLAEQYRVLMTVAPLARTPMSKELAKDLDDLARKLDQFIDSLTSKTAQGAQAGQEKRSRLGSLRGKLKPGEVVVILDAGEPSNLELFKDAKVLKE